jgi:hypothetical protein
LVSLVGMTGFGRGAGLLVLMALQRLQIGQTWGIRAETKGLGAIKLGKERAARVIRMRTLSDVATDRHLLPQGNSVSYAVWGKRDSRGDFQRPQDQLDGGEGIRSQLVADPPRVDPHPVKLDLRVPVAMPLLPSSLDVSEGLDRASSLKIYRRRRRVMSRSPCGSCENQPGTARQGGIFYDIGAG